MPRKNTARKLRVETFDDVMTHDCCRFIAGDRREGTAIYCPNPRKPGKAWCATHAAIVYVSAPPKEVTGICD